MTANVLQEVWRLWENAILENAIPFYFICHSRCPSSSAQKLMLSDYYTNVLVMQGRCTLLIKNCHHSTLGLQGKEDAKQNGCRHLSSDAHGNSWQDDSQSTKFHIYTDPYEKENSHRYFREQNHYVVILKAQTGKNTLKIQYMKLSQSSKIYLRAFLVHSYSSL